MFTGIVEGTTKVVSITSPAKGEGMTCLKVLPLSAGDDRLGDSIAINGCCLTLAKKAADFWQFDISFETLAITTLKFLKADDYVNVERAMTAATRFGGHLVSGHVDGMGEIKSVNSRKDGWDVALSVSSELGRYCILKGSITVQGVSLTINRLCDEQSDSIIHLCLIPTTLNETNLKSLTEGCKVNIEVDQIAKYVERLTQAFNRAGD